MFSQQLVLFSLNARDFLHRLYYLMDVKILRVGHFNFGLTHTKKDIAIFNFMYYLAIQTKVY